MKINELQKPHLYLDMDGVQADFFSHWASLHNVSHYKDIPNQQESMNKLAHSSPKKVYDFFRYLKPLPGGDKIVKWLKEHKIHYTVLSAPLRGPFARASIHAKRDWLDQHNPGTSGHAIFTNQKFMYAKHGGIANVLVDDYGPYLQAWHYAGGIAVKHADDTTDHTIQVLTEIYFPNTIA